jgi:hypothetical protein
METMETEMETRRSILPMSRRQKALLESVASAFPDLSVDGEEGFQEFNRARNSEYPIEDVIAHARKNNASNPEPE